MNLKTINNCEKKIAQPENRFNLGLNQQSNLHNLESKLEVKPALITNSGDDKDE